MDASVDRAALAALFLLVAEPIDHVERGEAFLRGMLEEPGDGLTYSTYAYSAPTCPFCMTSSIALAATVAPNSSTSRMSRIVSLRMEREPAARGLKY